MEVPDFPPFPGPYPDKEPTRPVRNARDCESAQPMAMRENARHLLDRRAKELRRKAEYLDILNRALPSAMSPELEDAVYEIVSDLRR